MIWGGEVLLGKAWGKGSFLSLPAVPHPFLRHSHLTGEVAGGSGHGARRKLVFPSGAALRCTEPYSLCEFVTVCPLLFCRGERKGTGNQKNVFLLSRPWRETEMTQRPLSWDPEPQVPHLDRTGPSHKLTWGRVRQST